MNGRRCVRLLAGALFLALTITACADDDETAGDDSSTTVDAGGDAPASGEPISIGFVNLEGGAVSLPEIRVGAEVAVDHINTDLGGVGGRPLELITCDVDLSPERSIDCANQLVDAEVEMVVLGIDPAIDAALPVYEAAGIPLTGASPITPAALTAEIATFFGASFFAVAASPLQYEADAGAESVTYLLGEGAVNRELVETTLEPFAEQLGIDFRTVYYDPAAPDWNVVAATALADDPDAIGSPSATDPECTGFVAALRNAGFSGDVLAGQCTSFVDELGAQAAGALTTSALWLPNDVEGAPEEAQEQLQTYIDEMTEAGEEDRIDSYASGWFAIMRMVESTLETVEGDLEPATVLAALDGIVDQPSFMGANISCDGSVSPGESVCGSGVLIYEVDEAGQLALVSDGFIDVSDILPR